MGVVLSRKNKTRAKWSMKSHPFQSTPLDKEAKQLLQALQEKLVLTLTTTLTKASSSLFALGGCMNMLPIATIVISLPAQFIVALRQVAKRKSLSELIGFSR